MKKAYSKLTIFVLALLWVACAAAWSADGLVLHLSLDQGTIDNGVATDLSGQGNDGLVTGDPQHAEGVLGDALVFDGTDDVIEVPLQPSITFEQGDSLSVMAWIKTSVHPNLNDGVVGNYRTSTTPFWALLANDAAGGMTLYLRDVGGTVSRLDSPDPVNTDTWIHVAGVRDQQTKEAYLYLDGEVVASMADATANINSGQSIWIGDHLSRFYDGSMDDVRIYNSALDQAAIQQAMKGSTELASAPNPENDVADVLRDVTLAWKAGEFAVKHNVYLGTDFEDVNSAAADSTLLIGPDLSTPSLEAGILNFGQTYYWRVDEVNSAPDNTVFKGEIWRFTVEPFSIPVETITATASSANADDMGPENTINGIGLNELDQHSTAPTDMWLSGMGDATPSIQYAFDKAYKLHEMWVWNSNQLIESFVGLGAKDVVIETSLDGVEWTVLEDARQFAQATGAADYVANTIVDLGGVLAQYVKITINAGYGMLPQYGLAEVRFLYVPTFAREAQPADGESTEAAQVALSWRAGREAATHEVYLGTDPADLALLGTTEDNSYDAGALNYDSTYYWQIVEVNEAETPAAHAGPVCRFSTPAYGTVDHFEQYDDNCGRVFFAWEDGLGHNGGEELDNCDVAPSNGNGGGSIVGNAMAPFAEQTIVNTGSSQSMPFEYDNTFGASEATLTLNGQDWTASAVQSLSLMFFGQADNSGQLYVKINNSKVTYDGAADDIKIPQWQAWNIDLSALSGLQNVTTLTIGVEGASAAGKLYIDDIRLYPNPGELIVPTEPSADALVAYLSFDEGSGTSAADSSGNNNQGDVMGDAQWVAGKVGGALAFDGVDDMVVVNQNSALPIYNNGTDNAYSIAMWVKGAPQNDMRIFSEGSTTDNNPLFNLGTQNAGATGQFDVYIRPTGMGHTYSVAEPFDDTWHHIAWVDENGAARLYVDGLLDAGDFSYTRATLDLNTTSIGGILRAAASHFFTGQIDEVRIYRRALSAGEVLGLAGKTEPIHKPF